MNFQQPEARSGEVQCFIAEGCAEVDHGDWLVVTIRDRCHLQARLKTKLGPRVGASGVEHRIRNGQGHQHGATKETFAARREGTPSGVTARCTNRRRAETSYCPSSHSVPAPTGSATCGFRRHLPRTHDVSSLGLRHSVRQYGLALIQIREKVYEIRPANWSEFGSRPYDIVEMAKGRLWKIEEENWTRATLV